MADMCTQSYLDNELASSSCLQLANELVVTLDDSLNHHYRWSMKVYSWAKVFEFKQLILEHPHFQGVSISELRLFHKNIQLNNDKRTLLDYNLGNGSIIVIERRNKIQLGSKGVINPYKLFEKNNQKVSTLIKQSIEAISSGNKPTLTSQGTSGVYMIEKNEKQKISIFKPFDQEVNAPNNPRDKIGKLGSEGISKGILSGECATREVAAYLLDNQSGNFHSVPTTTYVQFYHPTFVHKELVQKAPIPSSQQLTLNVGITKHGSLQQFVNSKGIIGNYGSSRFSDRQIHKIGILDIRILNCDRNQENILVRELEKNKFKLIPIDHGLSFPDNLQISQESLLWMSFPQSKKSFSQQQLKFIEDINPARDAELLQSKLGFRQICLRNMRISQIFLKKAAALGFSLYDMGKMLYRSQQNEDQNGKSKRSIIQTIVMQAEGLYLNALESIEKQNIDPFQNIEQLQKQGDDQCQDGLDELDEQAQQSCRKSGTSTSTGTCQSIKSILSLKKKNSLPQLRRQTTSYHENRHRARKQREGVNGIGKTVWNKYHQQQWNQLFYYYFENLLDTMLHEKTLTKSRKSSIKSSCSK